MRAVRLGQFVYVLYMPTSPYHKHLCGPLWDVFNRSVAWNTVAWECQHSVNKKHGLMSVSL